MTAIVLLVSFLLEGIVSNFVSINGYFIPLFTLIALICVCPLVENNKYYKYALVTGFAYDLFYTDTVILNALIFCFMAFIIKRLNLVLSDNLVNHLIIVTLCIILYRVVTYGILVLMGNISFDILALLFSILRSLIINLIYSIILSLAIKRLKRKLF